MTINLTTHSKSSLTTTQFYSGTSFSILSDTLHEWNVIGQFEQKLEDLAKLLPLVSKLRQQIFV